MKNLHVLPTDKPSRLFDFMTALVLIDKISLNDSGTNQHIYITSDEEIKEGDWVMNHVAPFFNPYKIKDSVQLKLTEDALSNGKGGIQKIILTTDQDLINDGVQAIDDEFLEWFVTNPSCEEVKVEEIDYKIPKKEVDGYFSNETLLGYKIIIPKEEPEEEIECSNCGNLMSLTEDGSIYVCTNSECTSCYEPYEEEETKQETLEEAAENYLQKWRLLSNIHLSNVIHSERCKNNFIAGAKWQAEKFKVAFLNEPISHIALILLGYSFHPSCKYYCPPSPAHGGTYRIDFSPTIFKADVGVEESREWRAYLPIENSPTISRFKSIKQLEDFHKGMCGKSLF